jgi:hypothetical protein
MDGHATLDELLNAPAGTVFRERRYVDDVIRVDGAEYRMGREYRTAGHAAAQVRTFEQRLRHLEEAGFTEPFFEGLSAPMLSAAFALAPEGLGRVNGAASSLTATNGHKPNRQPPPVAVPSNPSNLELLSLEGETQRGWRPRRWASPWLSGSVRADAVVSHGAQRVKLLGQAP